MPAWALVHVCSLRNICLADTTGAYNFAGPLISFRSAFVSSRDSSRESGRAAHLGQGENGDLVLRVVGQVLVQVGEAGRVAAQLIIYHPQLVTCRTLPARTQRTHPRAAQETYRHQTCPLPTCTNTSTLSCNIFRSPSACADIQVWDCLPHANGTKQTKECLIPPQYTEIRIDYLLWPLSS